MLAILGIEAKLRDSAFDWGLEKRKSKLRGGAGFLSVSLDPISLVSLVPVRSCVLLFELCATAGSRFRFPVPDPSSLASLSLSSGS